MIYLASPYSHHDPDIRRRRFISACRHAAYWIEKGEFLFSPIVHSVALSIHGDIGGDWAAWRPLETHMIGLSSMLRVLKLPGWEDSVGVGAEIQLAKDMDLPIVYIAEFLW